MGQIGRVKRSLIGTVCGNILLTNSAERRALFRTFLREPSVERYLPMVQSATLTLLSNLLKDPANFKQHLRL
jgi:hypothetical protein